MESNYGNIELMKTMAVLNMFPNLISNNNGNYWKRNGC